MDKFIYICGWIFLVIILIALMAVLIVFLNHAVASAIAVKRLWVSENSKTVKSVFNSIKYWLYLTITGNSWSVMTNLDTNERVYWPGREPKNEKSDSDDDAE